LASRLQVADAQRPRDDVGGAERSAAELLSGTAGAIARQTSGNAPPLRGLRRRNFIASRRRDRGRPLRPTSERLDHRGGRIRHVTLVAALARTPPARALADSGAISAITLLHLHRLPERAGWRRVAFDQHHAPPE
jgi:hypothetical protein